MIFYVNKKDEKQNKWELPIFIDFLKFPPNCFLYVSLDVSLEHIFLSKIHNCLIRVKQKTVNLSFHCIRPLQVPEVLDTSMLWDVYFVFVKKILRKHLTSSLVKDVLTNLIKYIVMAYFMKTMLVQAGFCRSRKLPVLLGFLIAPLITSIKAFLLQLIL